MAKFRLLFLLLIICFSCTKETVNNYNNSTGTILGLVNYYPKNQINNTSIPFAGVTVSIDGTSISAVTDTNGEYSLQKVPNGVYTISYNKTGYGEVKAFNTAFPGNGQDYITTVIINKIPGYTFSKLSDSVNLNIQFTVDTGYTLNGFFYIKNPDTTYNIHYIMFYGLTPDFSFQNEISTYANLPGNLLISNFSFDVSGAVQTIRQTNPNYHGVKVYLKIYPTGTEYYYGDYTDPILGEQFTSVGPPLAGQFVIP